MAELTATCGTEGCASNGVPITMEYDPDLPPSAVACGACGRFIDDVTGLPPSPQPKAEPA